MPRALGDLYPVVDGDGLIDEDDLQAYQNAIDLNRIHSHWDNIEDPNNPGQRINKIIDIDNGGLLIDQARVASLHKTGFISNIDKMLIDSFIHNPQGETLEAHINAIDSKEVVPPIDPSVKTLEELRRNITDNIQTLVIFQAQAFLEFQKTAPSSLHDVEQKMQRVWADAYKYDYETAAQTDANMETALDPTKVDGSKYPEDDGHKVLPQDMYGHIETIIRVLTKAQLDDVISEYWKPSEAPTISDPPTTEQQNKVIDHIWNETGVERGLLFYNEWKDVEPEPGPDPTPTEDLIRPIPETLPTLSGELQDWVNASDNKTDFTTAIENQHPHQIITCAFKTGVTNASTTKSVDLICWEYQSGSWTKIATYGTGSYVGGGSSGGVVNGGIYAVTDLCEGDTDKVNRTPAGAFQLGSYTTNEDDVGAFGIDTAWGADTPDIHYRVLNANNVHWVDMDGMNAGLTNWYNMFANCDTKRALIQYKRADWDRGVSGGVTDKDGNTYATASTPFKYGQFYTATSLADSNLYTENLYEHTSSSSDAPYNHAVVIRFNMPPHVTTPVKPGNSGSGSAYFLHTSNGGNTAGCVSTLDANMIAIIKWLKLDKNPHIFIRLPSGS